MAEIAELERRMRAALARISAGVERLPVQRASHDDAPSAAQALEIANLHGALDAERVARSEAAAPLDGAASDASHDAALKAEVDRLTRQLDAQGLDNQRLRTSLAQMREELRRLREAVQSNVADAPLLNRAVLAELESLRAGRASETTEMADILAALAAIVEAQEVPAHA